MNLITKCIIVIMVIYTVFSRYAMSVLYEGFRMKTIWSTSDFTIIAFIILIIICIAKYNRYIFSGVLVLFFLSNIYFKLTNPGAVPLVVWLQFGMFPAAETEVVDPEGLDESYKKFREWSFDNELMTTPLKYIVCEWRADDNKFCKFLP